MTQQQIDDDQRKNIASAKWVISECAAAIVRCEEGGRYAKAEVFRRVAKRTRAQLDEIYVASPHLRDDEPE